MHLNNLEIFFHSRIFNDFLVALNQFPAAEAAALLTVDYTQFSLTPIVPTTTTLEAEVAPSKKKKKSKSKK